MGGGSASSGLAVKVAPLSTVIMPLAVLVSEPLTMVTTPWSSKVPLFDSVSSLTEKVAPLSTVIVPLAVLVSEPLAMVTSPLSSKVPLLQTAPGRYVAEFETPLSGPYHLELTQKVGGQMLYQQSRGISVGYSDELRLKPTNETLLKSIAQSSGGKYQITAAEVFAPTGRTARRPTPLWPWLATAAALLLVLDVALRRIDLSLLRQRQSIGSRQEPHTEARRHKASFRDTSKTKLASGV